MSRKRKNGPGGRKQWRSRQERDALASMIGNIKESREEPGPARIPSLVERAQVKSDPADMLQVRNRKQARRDAHKAKVAPSARKRLSELLRDSDRKRAETAAEVIDPATGKTREEPVEERVKRRGLSVIKNKIIGGDE